MAEIKVRAERRAGELLEKMEKHKGGGGRSGRKRSHRVSALRDLGIGHKQSSRWQKIAGIPAKTFDLDPHEWGGLFKTLLECKGVKTGQGARNDKATCTTVVQVAEQCGVPKQTAYDRMHEHDTYEALRGSDDGRR